MKEIMVNYIIPFAPVLVAAVIIWWLWVPFRNSVNPKKGKGKKEKSNE